MKITKNSAEIKTTLRLPRERYNKLKIKLIKQGSNFSRWVDKQMEKELARDNH